uniref:Uncharacterized protein n=1 Tax=Anopheles minimus TaxID=112268 RepID=A0A182WNN3_9DIPT
LSLSLSFCIFHSLSRVPVDFPLTNSGISSIVLVNYTSAVRKSSRWKRFSFIADHKTHTHTLTHKASKDS